MNLNHRLCSVLHAVCLVPVATLCVMLSLMLCCPARAFGYKSGLFMCEMFSDSNTVCLFACLYHSHNDHICTDILLCIP